MDYNTSRNKLVISEYGRNVQNMVEYAISLEDREKRTRLASLIVNVMAQLNPSIRELHDYKQKLWDHLHIISGFRLDVDSPYPIPDKEKLETRPERLQYYSNGIKYRHYGKHIENIIKNVIAMEEGEKKDEYIRLIANQLKKSYLNWNRESVTDEVIAAHLADLSGGQLILGEDVELARTHDILQRQGSTALGSKQKKHNHRPGQPGYKQQGYSQQGSYYRNKRNKRSQ
jgi:hypothetical protein